MIKVRVIKAMIQVVRPTALELKCIELYNATAEGKKEATKLNWEPIG